MTDAEVRLWSRIKGKQLAGVQFYRQRPLGRYIVDFYCPRAKLVIEVDGGQHMVSPQREKDQARDAFLRSIGIEVLRFDDRDALLNTDGVLYEILEFLERRMNHS